MTVPAFSLPAVLPGAPFPSTGMGGAAPTDKGGLFEGLLSDAVQAEQGGWSATTNGENPAPGDLPTADAIKIEDPAPTADAGVVLMLFSPAAPPVVQAAPEPAETEATATPVGANGSARLFGGHRSAPRPDFAANDLLSISASTPEAEVAETLPAADADLPTPPARLGDFAGLAVDGRSAAPTRTVATPAETAPSTAQVFPTPDKPSLPAPAPVTAQPVAAAVAPVAAQVAAAAPVAPAVANETEAADLAALPVAGPTAGKAAAIESETRRAAASSRAERRDGVARGAGGQSINPFAPKSDLVATAVATTDSTTGDADAGSGSEPDLAPVDVAEAADSRQLSMIAETRVQAAQANAAADSAAAARGSPETVAKLAADIVRKLEGQNTRFDLELNPHGMGKVDVAIEIDKDGKLTAAMSFDSAQSASDLRGRAGELRTALEQAGFDIAEGGLTFDLSGQGAGFTGREAGQQERAWNGRAFQRAQSGADDADLSLASTPSTLSRWTRSGVDIRI